MAHSSMPFYSYCIFLIRSYSFTFNSCLLCVLFFSLNSSAATNGKFNSVDKQRINSIIGHRTNDRVYNSFHKLNALNGVRGLVLACTVTVQNACLGGGDVIFSHNHNNNNGTWIISGCGTYTVSGNEVIFKPTTAGCFTAQYSQGGTCDDIQSFLVYSAKPILIADTNTSNASLTIPYVEDIPGFKVKYSIDGAPFTDSQVIPSSVGCHTFIARYVNISACGTTPALTPSDNSVCNESNTVSAVIFPLAPVLSPPENTCATAFELPFVFPVAGFAIEYSIDGGPFSSSPSTATTGCHTIVAR